MHSRMIQASPVPAVYVYMAKHMIYSIKLYNIIWHFV